MQNNKSLRDRSSLLRHRGRSFGSWLTAQKRLGMTVKHGHVHAQTTSARWYFRPITAESMLIKYHCRIP